MSINKKNDITNRNINNKPNPNIDSNRMSNENWKNPKNKGKLSSVTNDKKNIDNKKNKK